MGWRVETEQREISVALNLGGASLKEAFHKKLGLFWAVTMRRRGALLVFMRREVRNARCPASTEQCHIITSPTSHMNF